MTEKPDYLTGYMMLKDILPELSKRINLGADKYEPDDWKTRPPKYFWAKLHRHMKDAVEDWDALDEDDLPHLTAMWFHITALVWKREYGKPETTGHMGSDDPEAATEPTEDAEVLCFEEWAKGEGWRRSGFPIAFWRRNLGRKEHFDTEMHQLYAEYLAETKRASGHGTGDTVVSSNLA